VNDKPFAELRTVEGVVFDLPQQHRPRLKEIWVAGIRMFQGFTPKAQENVDHINAAVSALVAAARKEERERCAKLADPCFPVLAAAIRALGE